METVFLVVSLFIAGSEVKHTSLKMPSLDMCFQQAKVFHQASKELDFDFKKTTTTTQCIVQVDPPVCEKDNMNGPSFGTCVFEHES